MAILNAGQDYILSTVFGDLSGYTLSAGLMENQTFDLDLDVTNGLIELSDFNDNYTRIQLTGDEVANGSLWGPVTDGTITSPSLEFIVGREGWEHVNGWFIIATPLSPEDDETLIAADLFTEQGYKAEGDTIHFTVNINLLDISE